MGHFQSCQDFCMSHLRRLVAVTHSLAILGMYLTAILQPVRRSVSVIGTPPRHMRPRTKEALPYSICGYFRPSKLNNRGWKGKGTLLLSVTASKLYTTAEEYDWITELCALENSSCTILGTTTTQTNSSCGHCGSLGA